MNKLKSKRIPPVKLELAKQGFYFPYKFYTISCQSKQKIAMVMEI